MNRVAVRILHAEPGPDAGSLERWLAEARSANALGLLVSFARAGAADVGSLAGPPDGVPFAARIRALVGSLRPGDGLVLLGSGSIPLARPGDLAAFVEVAASGERRALANNRYSADVIALGQAEALVDLPDLPGDNAVPRWLEEVAGFAVHDLRRRRGLAMDLDSPLDVVLVRRSRPSLATEAPDDTAVVEGRLAALREVADDRRAELLIAGRTSAGTMAWLERSTACRVRALVEERGLRASTPAALGTPAERLRPPRSVLGLLLDDRGPEALGGIVAELADGALIDSRVLLAHRLGVDEAGWPPAEERFASDLLLVDRVRDPWLRALTVAARDATVPIVLGGHSLVGPGVTLALGGRR